MRNLKKYMNWWLKGLARKWKKMSVESKRLLIVSLFALIVGNIFGNIWGHASEEKKSEEKVAEAVARVQKEDKEKLLEVESELYALKDEMKGGETELPWNLVLVNKVHPMEEGYVPELAELETGYSVDTRILDAAREMLADAKEAGLQVKICSAYRSVDRQETLLSDAMKERVKEGMTYWEAYEDSVIYIAPPGTSEHALGLALDLVSNEYTELDEMQENTEESKWLAQNCHKYGFILRYPPEKTGITGIVYEPWHYRYVGVEVATEIMEEGITLEEYLEKKF